ncbi:MAG: 3-deoxy-D-manno-octulosonic acid transferase [Flavobacteriales bacterium]|nr:3-deoxy-D-manno-octulosonic acid transferase [Flavobacteriales bacterium]
MFQQLIYDLMIRAYRLAIAIVSPFNGKAGKWISGRRGWREKLRNNLNTEGQKVFWVHAASLGEFEQGRPVIDMMRSEFPQCKIVLTFFSPSGYEIRKGYDKVDLVTYLPLDTRSNARDFLTIVNPSVAIFIKYEFWFNHLAELKARSIPVLLVAGRLHEKQGFFKPWGGFFRKGLSAFEHFFLQDKTSAYLLDELGFKNYTVNGDTRFDRVLAIQEEDRKFPEIEKFSGGHPTIVVGSSWPYDEILIQKYIAGKRPGSFKVIFAPHEIDKKRINEFINRSPLPAIRYSDISNSTGSESVLFIDSIGMLSHLYRYSTVAMIGGGFGAGIHNTLEAAVWSKPLVFGPRYKMFREAVDLVENGSAFPVESQMELDEILDKLLFGDSTIRELAGQMAWRYCESGQGASKQVVQYVSASI